MRAWRDQVWEFWIQNACHNTIYTIHTIQYPYHADDCQIALGSDYLKAWSIMLLTSSFWWGVIRVLCICGAVYCTCTVWTLYCTTYCTCTWNWMEWWSHNEDFQTWGSAVWKSDPGRNLPFNSKSTCSIAPHTILVIALKWGLEWLWGVVWRWRFWLEGGEHQFWIGIWLYIPGTVPSEYLSSPLHSILNMFDWIELDWIGPCILSLLFFHMLTHDALSNLACTVYLGWIAFVAVHSLNNIRCGT